MKEKSKEILVGYRRAIGITDIQGIIDYIKEEEPLEKVYLLAAHPIAEPVKEYAEKNLKGLVPFEFIVCKNFDEEIERIKALHKGKEVWVTSLDDFGDRALSFDPD